MGQVADRKITPTPEAELDLSGASDPLWMALGVSRDHVLCWKQDLKLLSPFAYSKVGTVVLVSPGFLLLPSFCRGPGGDQASEREMKCASAVVALIRQSLPRNGRMEPQWAGRRHAPGGRLDTYLPRC